MSSRIQLIATIKVKAGKETETDLLLRSLLKPTHQEAGCIRYALHRSLQDMRTYYFIEEWRSQEDLQKHLNSHHITAVMQRKNELLDLLDITFVSPIPGGDPAKEAIWDFSRS